MTRAEFIKKYGNNRKEFTEDFDETVSEMLTVIVKTERKREHKLDPDEADKYFRKEPHNNE